LQTFLDSVPENVITVVDEAYFEYVEDPDYPDSLEWLPDYPNLIVTRTFSKAYGLAGLRVGYAVCDPQIASLLNRARAPFNVTSMGLAAAEAALKNPQHLAASVELNRAGLAQLKAGFEKPGLYCIPSVGNFICVDTGRSAVVIYEALLKEGVIVRPTGVPDLHTFLRVSVGTQTENTRCLEAFAKVLGNRA
jgi:histidinol-phosphate aminotransferase